MWVLFQKIGQVTVEVLSQAVMVVNGTLLRSLRRNSLSAIGLTTDLTRLLFGQRETERSKIARGFSSVDRVGSVGALKRGGHYAKNAAL
jgi:acetylglutamate kinase